MHGLNMKTCKKCKVEKPFSEFYKHKGMADGYLLSCKACEIKRSALQGDRSKYYKQYDAQRTKSLQVRICRLCGKEFRADTRETNRGKAIFCSLTCANRQRATFHHNEFSVLGYKERMEKDVVFSAQKKAHRMVKKAIEIGSILKKPCEKCGSSHKVNAHHDDYRKPLDVRWLCPKHHRQWHKENGRAPA